MTCALVTWVWETLLLVAAIATLLRTQPRARASVRYLVWCATLGLVCAWPAVVWPHPDRGAAPAVGTPGAALFAGRFTLELPDVPEWFLALGLVAWLATIVVRLSGVVGACRYLARLKTSAVPLSAERVARLAAWRRCCGRGRRVVLCLSSELGAPAALGLGRAIIAIPRDLDDRLEPPDLDRVVLHELAHLERGDDWARLAQRVVQAFFAWHPAVWWVGRQIDREREAACDAFVVAQLGDARGYARMLTKIAALATWRARVPSVAPAAATTRDQLSHRVVRLLASHHRRPWTLGSSVAAGLATLVTSVTAAALAGSLLAFTESRQIVMRPSPEAPSNLGARALAPVGDRVAPMDAGALDGTAAKPARAPARRALERRRDRPPEERATAVAATLPDREAALRVLPLTLDIIPISGFNQRLDDGRITVPQTRALPKPSLTAVVRPDRTPWAAVADAGTATGSSMKRVGVATGALFARLGRSIGGAF